MHTRRLVSERRSGDTFHVLKSDSNKDCFTHSFYFSRNNFYIQFRQVYNENWILCNFSTFEVILDNLDVFDFS